MAARRQFKQNQVESVPEVIEPAEPAERRAFVGPDVLVIPPRVETMYVPDIDRDMMETGCRRLLDYMPDAVRELIYELHASLGGDVPLWQLIGAYTLRAHEFGEIFSAQQYILEDWKTMVAPGSLRPCKTCGEPMKTLGWSQLSCCNHCGRQRVVSFGHNPDCTRNV